MAQFSFFLLWMLLIYPKTEAQCANVGDQTGESRNISKTALFLSALLFHQHFVPAAGDSVCDAKDNPFEPLWREQYSRNKAILAGEEHTFHEYRFDPKRQKVKIVYAEEGELVSNFVLDNGAEAGINGGFWNDIYSANFFTLSLRKLASRWGISKYIPAPSGILEINNRIIADSGAKTAALGWTVDGGKAQIGEITSQWWISVNNKFASQATRVTPYNASEGSQYLYLSSSALKAEQNVVDVRIKIDDRRIVSEITRINDKISPDLPNSYRTTDPHLGPLSLDDVVEIKHKYISSTNNFENMDYVINGDQVLVRDFKAQSVREDLWGKPRTAVCLLPHGDWILLVAPNLIQLRELALYLERKKCESAIALDGGPSSSLFVNQMEKITAVSEGRVVSDAIIVMPAWANQTFPQEKYQEIEAFVATIENHQVETFKEMVKNNPHLIESAWFLCNPIDVAISRYERMGYRQTEILRFLVENVGEEHLGERTRVRHNLLHWVLHFHAVLYGGPKKDLQDIAEILIRRKPSLLMTVNSTKHSIDRIIISKNWDLLRVVLDVSPEILTLSRPDSKTGFEQLSSITDGSLPDDILFWLQSQIFFEPE